MITYLWTKNDGTYVGLNGHVYSASPTTDEIIELQQYAQGFVNDQYAYGQAFATNVASKIGVASDQYLAYYNTDDSCLPDICKVTANLAEDDSGRPYVKSEIYTADTGCRVLDFTFYNIKGECECTIEASQIYVRYARSDCFQNGYPTQSCMFPTPDGCDYMGLLITSNEEDVIDPTKYSWFKIGGLDNNATSYISYVFARATSKPATPSGGTYQTGMPTAPANTWYDTVPGHNNYGIWMSKRVFWSDEISPENPNGPIEHTNLAWSDPVLMTDNKTFQSEWAAESNETNQVYLNQNNPTQGPKLPSLNEARFQDPTNLTEGINETAWRQAAAGAGCGNWSDNAAGATYLAWSNCRNGLWDDWTIARIKGEGGDPGANAGRVFMIFASLPKDDGNGQLVTPNRPEGGHWDIANNKLETNGNPPLVGTTTTGEPVSWSPDNARQSSDMATWLSTGSFDGDTGNLIGQWSEPVCITGEDGIDGTDGENREYIYARFATLDDYMCYASGYSYTEGVECEEGPAAECAQMLATCTDDAENYQQDDYIPLSGTSVYAHWQDHPEGIEPEWRVEACCLRMKEEIPDPDDPTGEATISQWGCWIGPFIWASWGEDGIDGDGVEYIFCVTTTAKTQCCYVEYTKDPALIESWYPMDHVPAKCENEQHENDENCVSDEFSHPYITVEEGGETKYYYKKTEFIFPYDNMMPPLCRNYGIYCDTLPSSPDFTLYTTASNDEEKDFLYSYYQLPEFIPGDKIKDDIAKDDSPIMLLAQEFRPEASIAELRSWLNGDEFVKGWERNWTDNPLDIGPQQPYEWVCIRKYKRGTHDTTKEWQAFSEPKLWANWAYDGTSTFTSMVFTRTNDDIGGMSLCGGTFDFPMPGATEDGTTNTCTSEDETTVITYDPVTDRSTAVYQERSYVWEDSVPVFEDDQANTDNIWMSMRIFGDEITEESQGWTAPVRMSDTADFNVEWCIDYLTQEQINKIKHSSLNFGIFTDLHRDDPEEDAIHSKAERDWEEAVFNETGSIWSDKGDGAIYMATTTFRNGKWTNWTVSKIKGEKGDAGTGIQLLGSTKGVCAFNLLSPNLPSSARTALAAINAATEVGDIWGALLCGQDIDCIGENGNETGNVQFYRKTATGWVALACEKYYAYEPSTEGEFIRAQESEDPADTTATWIDLPDEVTSASTKYVHINDESTGVNEYYRLAEVPGLTVGDTIIVNNITESYSPTQGVTGEQLRNGCCDDPNNQRCLGIENGDFYVWDGDSWSKTANLMGPASYVHVKYADDISLDGNYFKLTEPDMQTTDSWGELPGKYIGMYIDDRKGDAEGLAGDENGPNTAVTPTCYWSAKSGPYKWTRFMGEDGLGYEYIYTRSSADTMNYPIYMGGRPYVPRLKPEFINSATYQADDFVPSLANVPATAWTETDDSGFSSKPEGYDWTDNAISPDPVLRYRWKCYRTKEKGKWGPFIGDNSTQGKMYAIFDTNCSDELLEVDLTREFLPVFVDNDGKVAEEATYTTDVLMKQAQKAFIISNITSATTPTSAATGVELSVNGMNTTAATLTVRLTTACTAGDGFTIEFTVTGHEEGSVITKTGKKSLTVVAMKTDVLYTIYPSLPAVHRDGAGNLVDTALTCTITKKVIGVDEVIEIDSNHLTGFLESEGLYLTWSYDSIGENTFDGSLDAYQLGQVRKQLTIRLRKAANPITSGALYAEEQLLVYADASSLIQADIDNEQDAIPLTYEGAVDGVVFKYLRPDGSRYAVVSEKPTSGTYYECVSVQTNISLFYGTKKTAIMGLSATTADDEGTSVPESPSAVAILKESGQPKVFVSCVNSDFDGVKVIEKAVTVYVLNGWENYPETLRVRLNVLCNEDGNVYSNVFSIAGVRAGSPGEHATIFNLLPESSFIVKHPDGTKTPSTLWCFVQKRTGLETDEYNIESDVQTILSENHMKIIYSKDNSDAWLPYDLHNGIGTEGENGVGTCITFELVKDTNTDGSNPIDREKVPVVSDGEPGRGIIATCRYYTLSNLNDSAAFSAYIAEHCPIPDYGVAPNDWVMIGSYIPSEGSREVININGIIPQTDLEEGSDNMYLWMVEVTWYSGGNPSVYKAPPMMLSKDGIGIKGSANYYISAATDTYNTVLQRYMAFCADDSLIPASPWTTEMPDGDLDAGFTIWYFTAIYYTDGTRSCLPLCVFKDGQMMKDIEVLRGMFGEANVEGKRGAYLREFLGVMGDPTPKDNGVSGAEDSDFYNLNVKAFMNATVNWYDGDPDLNGQQKKRLMFASGVSDLGGRDGRDRPTNQLNPPYGDNTCQIQISAFTATLKIWESGFLECECARISGEIRATSGSFGEYGNVVITEDGIEGFKVDMSTHELIYDTEDTDRPGIFGLTRNGMYMKGEVYAEGGQIGCLLINQDGSIEHTKNSEGPKVFEINKDGRFTATYTYTEGSDTYNRTLSSDRVYYSKSDTLGTTSYAELKEESVAVQKGTRYTMATSQYDISQMTPTTMSVRRVVAGTTTQQSYMNADSVYSNVFSAETGFYQISDARKKNVVGPLENVLQTVEAIPTVHYMWKEGPDTTTEHIGTLAQSLLPYYPEVVTGNEEDGYAVDYPKLSIIALAAIKELNKEVLELKDEIKRLKQDRNG